MSKISIKGVFVGGVTDVGLSMLLGLPFGIYAGFEVAIAHTPNNQMDSTIAAIMHRPAIFITGLLIGSGCSILGGYIAARLAKHDELLNGCLSAILCVASGIWVVSTHQSFVPIWQQIAELVVSPVLGLLGGYFRLRQKRHTLLPV